jgi:Retrotransposon gag protein
MTPKDYLYDTYTPKELEKLPYEFTPGQVLTKQDDEDFISYTAQWGNRPVVSPSSIGPWSFLNQDDSLELITPHHWERKYHGISNINITDWHILRGFYQGKYVQWSKNQDRFIYDNNRPVDFSKATTSGDEAEVSELLEASLQSVERTRSRLTPEASLPGAFETPDTPTPAPSSSKGKTPATLVPSRSTQQQQPTPPVSKAAPSTPTHQAPMAANPTAPKVLGSAPEPFDGDTTKAEAFWSNLANYYFLNYDAYSSVHKRIASALTHFKLGTPAGEWAKDRQKAALSVNPPDFGTWDDFRDAFKAHFIPVDGAMNATQKIFTFRMGNKAFSDWYQEWSTHASRSGANEETKMFAFRQNIPAALHAKILGVTPKPTTLARLVELAKEFDESYRMFTSNSSSNTNPRRRTNVRGTSADDGESATVALADFPKTTKFKKLSQDEKQKRREQGRCLYCNASGHWADKCPEKPQRNKKFRQNQFRSNPTRTRAIEPGEGNEDPSVPDNDALPVARFYHEPKDALDFLATQEPDF